MMRRVDKYRRDSIDEMTIYLSSFECAPYIRKPMPSRIGASVLRAANAASVPAPGDFVATASFPAYSP
jgi:hypothetical protein